MFSAKRQMIWLGAGLALTTALAAYGRIGWFFPIAFGLGFLMNAATWLYLSWASPRGSRRSGDIVAVKVLIDRKAWFMGRDALNTEAIIRDRNGDEVSVQMLPVHLPKEARKQVFSSSFAILDSSWTTNLAIKDSDKRRNAIAQAKADGYVFRLDEPVPVVFSQSDRGSVLVSSA